MTFFSQVFGAAWPNLALAPLKLIIIITVKPVLGAWSVMPMRRTDVKLTRLRIGHTRFTHRHLLLGEDAPECPSCKVSYTVRHILIDCPVFNNSRITFFNSSHLTLPDLPNLALAPLNPKLTHYAEVSKPSIATSTTQTDENITKVKCPPLQILKPLLSVPQPNASPSITSNSTSSATIQTNLLPSASSIKPTTQTESRLPEPISSAAAPDNSLNTSASSLSTETRPLTTSMTPTPHCDRNTSSAKIGKEGIWYNFSWVPGHVGIIGNEQADTAARSMSDHMQRPVCYQDLKTSAQNYIHRVWQETWKQQVLNKLHSIHPSTSHWAALPMRRHDVHLT
ncbi:RNA-directed DNA polymerase from mobile element jockey [Trichonephila clavipes]|nr:RNA-directed DNA polymerase from mobile element jockey [Trichonephila clavipes]